uniref:Retrotransposon protein, putative, Ty1-copia subclass n=1 Tax=Tanacetum cinerariifolium TaxID=118510 RepID=A0A699HN36_TANCI|nr:retrotransposon protein, putative, Ty1-copia subclass [Tanacetum cinerariifolium]
MVAYLEKSDDNTKFHQIVYFLSSCTINYALTISPTIYASYIEQFWNIASSKTINYVKKIHAIVDGKAVVISESSVRSDLLFDDEDGGVDSVERAITTNASLKVAHASDNILKTQTTAMPNVGIPQGIDTCGNPRRQDTMGGHTFGCGDGRMEHTIELMDTLPLTPHDSSLTGGYTPGSHEGRLKLEEFIDLCTTLSNKVSTLENELIRTKAVYHKAFITLTKRVKKLETQLKQNRSRAVIHSSYEEEPSVHINDSPKQGRMIEELEKDEDVNLLSFDEELAQKLYAEELENETTRQEQEKYNQEKALELQTHLYKREKYVEKGDQAKEIDWNDPTVLRYHALQNRPLSKDKVRKNMVMYVKNKEGYKQSYFKGMKYEDIRPIFERVDQKTKEKEEEVKAQADSDQEVEEMKLYMWIVPDEDISIDAIPLATKPLVIVEYKIVNKGKISTYHITKADGSIKRYILMINWLENIDREDLEALSKLVKDKHRNTRLEDGYERVLYGDLKVMFEPNIESYPKETMSYSFYYPPENNVIVARNVKFFKNSLISQEASGSLEDLEVILKEDAHNYENTSLHHDEDEQEIDKPQSDVESYLGKYFAMKDLGEAAYIHGIKIYRDRSRLLIGLCQSDYIEKIMKRFNMKNSKRRLVPMQKKPRLSKAQGASTLDEVKRM